MTVPREGGWDSSGDCVHGMEGGKAVVTVSREGVWDSSGDCVQGGRVGQQ